MGEASRSGRPATGLDVDTMGVSNPPAVVSALFGADRAALGGHAAGAWNTFWAT